MAFRFPEMKKRKEYINQHGLSRAAIFNSIEGSLARLETPYIDLYQIHRFDPDTPPEETMKALHDLVESGKVRYIGASSMACWQFALLNEVAEKHGWTKFVSMQNEYSLLYREEVCFLSLPFGTFPDRSIPGARDAGLLQVSRDWSYSVVSSCRGQAGAAHWDRHR